MLRRLSPCEEWLQCGRFRTMIRVKTAEGCGADWQDRSRIVAFLKLRSRCYARP